jgi:hypothetical protein
MEFVGFLWMGVRTHKKPGLGKIPGNSKKPMGMGKLVFTGKNGKNGKNCLF